MFGFGSGGPFGQGMFGVFNDPFFNDPFAHMQQMMGHAMMGHPAVIAPPNFQQVGQVGVLELSAPESYQTLP